MMESTRSGFNCLHGQKYEIKLFMLFVARATMLIYDKIIQSYECATKADGYGVFDDLVAKVHYNNEEGNTKEQTFCVQAKHSINAEKVVKTSDLKDKKSKWSLVKLYDLSEKVKTVHHKNCAFILYTNNKFDNEIMTSENIVFETRNAEKLAFQLLDTSEIHNENVRTINANRELSEIYREKKIPENFMKDIAIFDDQKSESELDSIIKSIILQLHPDVITKEYIQEIYNRMFEEFSTKRMSGKGVTSECNEIERIRKEVLISIEQKCFRQKFQEINLEFTGSSKIISEAIDNQSCGTYTKINSSSIELTAKKIKTYFRKHDKKTVVLRKSLFSALLPSLLNDESNDTRGTVFIINSYSPDENIDEEAKELLEKHGDTKIIQIAKKHDKSESISDKFDLIEFTDDSRHFIMEKSLSFQSHKVKLEDLINRDGDIIFDSETLRMLVENELEIGQKLEASDDDIYIPRNIKEPRIRMKILEDPEVKDIIFVSGVSEGEIVELIGKNKRHSLCNNIDLTNSNIIIHQASCQNHCKEFKRFCENHKNLNVHSFEKVGNYLRWENSRGNINILSKYLENVGNFASEDDFVETRKGKEITLISDEAGMGKSCLLTNIANKIKNKNPECLVLKINLNSVSPSLNAMKNNPPRSSIEIINHLTNSSNVFISNMVSNKQKNVYILLDGYNEIYPTYGYTIIRIIEILKADGICVYLAGRPNMLQDVAEKFSSIPFSIVPLTKENQIEFLTKYWQKNKCLGNENTKNEMSSIACTVLENFHENIGNLATEMTGIPLITRFLATIYEENIKELTSGNDKLADRLSGQKLHLIYKEFIMRMIDHYFDKLNLVSNTLFDIELKAHAIYSKLTTLAVYTTFKILGTDNGNVFSDFLSEHKSVTSDELFIAECKKIGLITTTSTNQVSFLHQTIADFLVAEYFTNILVQYENLNFLKCFTSIFVNPHFKSVRLFFDDMLSSMDIKNEFPNIDKLRQVILSSTENLIEISVCEGNVNILRLLLICLEGADVNISNNDGDTALHKASVSGNTSIVSMLLQAGADVNIKNNDGDTALHKASVVGNKSIVSMLLQAGADRNVRNNKNQTPSIDCSIL